MKQHMYKCLACLEGLNKWLLILNSTPSFFSKDSSLGDIMVEGTKRPNFPEKEEKQA